MSELNNILNGIYESVTEPVIVYNENGEVLWKNNSAEKLVGIDSESFNKVFSFLNLSLNSGKIRFENGGSFHRAEICGEKYIIVELNSDNPIIELFGNYQVVDFATNAEMQMRRAVTGISASCEMINELAEKSEKEETAFCLNNIITCCCRMMKSATLNSCLVAAADKNFSKSMPIAIDSLLTEIASGCSRALNNNCSAKYTGSCDCIIRSDKNMLTYFILGLVRKYLYTLNNKDKFILNFSASKSDELAVISISVESVGNEAVKFENIYHSNFEDFDNGINEILAQKLNADFSFSESKLNISLKCAKNISETVFESNKSFSEESLFSPYNIMLNDITNFRAFY